MKASVAINVVAIVVVLMLWLLPQNVLAGGPAPFVLPAQIELRYTANLRTGPGVTFPVKRVAAGGERLPVLACNATCDWYLVETDGWVAAFLTAPVRVISHVPTPLPSPVAVPAPVSKATAPALESIELSLPLITVREAAIDPHGTRVRFDTFIYRGPGTNYRFADYTARQGQPITVVGRNSLGNWYVLVSGDWIAAAAILNAPANLPIAWEPPPPPDGPERIGPRPVPVPTTAAHVATDSLFVEDLRYFENLQPALDNYAQGSQYLGQQLSELSGDPLLLFDSIWVLRTAVGIAQIREGNRIINELRPTSRTTTIHSNLMQVSSKLDEAMDLYTQAVDEVSADKVQQGSFLVLEARTILSETSRMMEALQAGH